MLELAITNLLVEEGVFQIPSEFGYWHFKRTRNYKELLTSIEKGMCANTFSVSLDTIDTMSTDKKFCAACDEIIDICLVLSFLAAKCVTVSGSTRNSDIQFLQLGDKFIRSCSIIGFLTLSSVSSLTEFFNDWFTTSYPNYKNRRLRLFLTHWLSGLTCFSLEDIFLSAAVQLDIVKQCERSKTYFKGMESASNRYGLNLLNTDFKKMRNDLVHEGVLSGSNFARKTKPECANVITDTLNWIDTYILAVLGVSGRISGLPRWKGRTLEYNLPAMTV
jgi:hypothetical protein